MNEFRAAIEARDLGAVEPMLHDDVVFHSPVVFKPYHGKAVTMMIFHTVIAVFEDFHYVHEFEGVDPHHHALVFEAKVDGLEITGCDFITYDDDGKIIDLAVMVRPLRAAQALLAQMSERLGANAPDGRGKAPAA